MARPVVLSLSSAVVSADQIVSPPSMPHVVKGQPGGPAEDGMEAQMQRAWLDLFDAVKAAGYDKRDLVKTTVSVTEGGHFKLFRAVRDRMMRGHMAASAYLHVAGVGSPACLVEIEGELIKAGPRTFPR